MTAPCNSSCPASDCAGCAFPPARAMCEPSSYCSQQRDCARRVENLCSTTEQHVDGTVLRHSSGAWCPIFIDSRTAALEFA